MKLIIKISLTLLMILKTILSTKIVKNAYLEGSKNWGGICTKGRHQSPVNILVDKNTEPSSNFIRVNYNMPTSLTIDKFYYDGVGMELSIPLGTLQYFNYLSNTQEIYEAHKISLHIPSEHIITRGLNTKRTVLELQIHHKFLTKNQIQSSHKNPINVKKAVLSVLFDIGHLEEGDKFFNQMGFNQYNYNKTGEFPYPREMWFVDQVLYPPATYGPGFNYLAFQGLINLLNADPELFYYYGSSNLPPCPEDTVWMIFGEPRSISQYQFDVMKKILVKKNKKDKFVGNNRSINIYDTIKRGKIMHNKMGLKEIMNQNIFGKFLS